MPATTICPSLQQAQLNYTTPPMGRRVNVAKRCINSVCPCNPRNYLVFVVGESNCHLGMCWVGSWAAAGHTNRNNNVTGKLDLDSNIRTGSTLCRWHDEIERGKTISRPRPTFHPHNQRAAAIHRVFGNRNFQSGWPYRTVYIWDTTDVPNICIILHTLGMSTSDCLFRWPIVVLPPLPHQKLIGTFNGMP